MTDQAEFLAELARAVRLAHERLDRWDRAGLEEILGTGSPLHTGIGPVKSRFTGLGGAPGGSSLANTIGNVQSLIGQQNLLGDAALFDFPSVSPIATTENIDGRWFIKYALNSGSPPSMRAAAIRYRRTDTANNPFSSSAIGVDVGDFPASASDVDVYTRAEPFSPVVIPTLPYLVAAVRVVAVQASTFTNISAARVQLEILSGASLPTTLEATSHDLDWMDMAVGTQLQLVASIQKDAGAFYATKWWWRLKLHVEGDGAGGEVHFDFGEPQLHFAYTGDPVPFIPPPRVEVAVFPAGDHVWTKPAGATVAHITCLGGGGGGGPGGANAAGANVGGGGGGGGGAISEAVYSITDLPDTVNVSVSPSAAPGVSGGDTYFGPTFATAYVAAHGGGQGSNGLSGVANPTGGAGGGSGDGTADGAPGGSGGNSSAGSTGGQSLYANGWDRGSGGGGGGGGGSQNAGYPGAGGAGGLPRLFLGRTAPAGGSGQGGANGIPGESPAATGPNSPAPGIGGGGGGAAIGTTSLSGGAGGNGGVGAGGGGGGGCSVSAGTPTGGTGGIGGPGLCVVVSW